MNPGIFREYDIRGVVETELTPEVVRDIGRALGSEAIERGARSLAVGRDCRLSSPSLRDSLVEGLSSTGLAVVDLGEVPTPLLYFGVHYLELDGGVQITGSHNPPEYNGFKMLLGREAIHGASIAALRSRIEARRFVEAPAAGSVESRPIAATYIDWVANSVSLAPGRRIKVVVDGGNGMGGPTAVELYRRLGAEVIELFIEPDGRFPNHHPDPTVPENLEALIAKVRETGADLGIGYDGDADRIGVIDEAGRILWGDRLMILLSRAVLEDVPGAAIVGEVKCSQTLYDDIGARGGRPIMWKTGHSLIKAKMKETDAALAGEMSGHIFYKHRYFGFDDAIYTGARLLEILSRSETPLSARLADVPETHVTPEIRIDCPEGIKFGVADRLARELAAEHEVITIDGVRVKFGDGAWALVRASNTQPALVLRAEASSPQRRDELEGWLREQVATTMRVLQG